MTAELAPDAIEGNELGLRRPRGEREPGIRDHYDPMCPICAAPIVPWKTKETPQGAFPIDRCPSCKYAFVNPRPNLQFLEEFYSSSGHGNESLPSQETYESAMKRESENPNSTLDATRMIGRIGNLLSADSLSSPKFLDVGCGYGFFSREALGQGFDVLALEFASVESRIAAQAIGSEPVRGTFEGFEAAPDSFSVILMSQILEHAADVNLWIAKANRLLMEGGVLAIALPNFVSLFRLILQESDPYICPPAHLNFFSARSLTELLTRQGFEVLDVQWVSRIPPSTFEKRLAKFGQTIPRVCSRLSTLPLKLADAIGLGMMLNVYARKRSCVPRK